MALYMTSISRDGKKPMGYYSSHICIFWPPDLTKSRNFRLSLKMPLNTLRVGHRTLTANIKEYQWQHRVCVCSPYYIQYDIQQHRVCVCRPYYI